MRVASAILLCRKATTNPDGTTTLDGLFDAVSMSRLPDRLQCTAYCKLEADPSEIGSAQTVRIELVSADEPNTPLSWYERKTNVRGAALDATPTVEILLEIEALIQTPGNYFVTVEIDGQPVGKGPIRISA